MRPSLVASLKLRMPFPSPRPISGSRFAPKIRMMMNRMTISSGMPRPITAPSVARAVLRHTITIAVVAVTLGLPARAQFSSGVNLVEVYASVTDDRGEPVMGLIQRDFELREDGEPQTI